MEFAVEQAFVSLREDVFELLQVAKKRNKLRGFIFRITMTSQPPNLGFSFHRSFALMRSGISQFLRECQDESGPSEKEVREKTTLGSIQVKAVPLYAERAGLVQGKRQLTAFGVAALKHDPHLSRVETLWMMHYFLAAPHCNVPNYWSFLCEIFENEGEISRDEIFDKLSQFAALHAPRELKPRTLKDTVKAFVGTYTKPDALGALDILSAQEDGIYRVNEEFAPRGSGVVACALGDFWEAKFGATTKVNLSDVSGPQGLGRALLLSTGEVNRALSALQSEGLVRLERATPPHQIARAWDDSAVLWERLYAN